MKNFIVFLIAVCSVSSCQKNKPDVKQLSNNEVVAMWSPNNEADLAGYKVHRGTESRNYDFSVVVIAPDTSVVISELLAGTEYFFAVTAFDTAGNESGFSSEVSITIPIPDTDPPDIPQNLRVAQR